MFKSYIEYIKDNPEGYWFKRKLYGWGWTPATWQGFAVIFAYLGTILLYIFNIDVTLPPHEKLQSIVSPIVIATILLIVVCYQRGESPKWQWGKPVRK